MALTSLDIERSDTETKAVISGDITEHTDLSVLLEDSKTSSAPLVLDLSGVKRINSCGVRGWVDFVRELTARRRPFALERCSFAVVSQLNMVSGFRGSAPVRSVFVPFYCERCNERHSQLLDLAKTDPAEAERIAQSHPACPKCGGDTDFDDVPESYFAFHDRTT